MSAIDTFFSTLNAENTPPVVFTPANLILSAPVPSNDVQYNTKITLTGVPNGPYAGSFDVFYHRVDLAELGPDVGLIRDLPFTSQSLIDAINTARAAFIELSDVDNISIPESMETGIPATITLTAKLNSLAWKGTIDVKIVIGIPASSNLLHHIVHTDMPAI